MTNLIEIPKKHLPKCGVCGNREVVKGYMEKKGKVIIGTYNCHGEEEKQEWPNGGISPDEVFKPVAPKKGKKTQTADDNLDGKDE